MSADNHTSASRRDTGGQKRTSSEHYCTQMELCAAYPHMSTAQIGLHLQHAKCRTQLAHESSCKPTCRISHCCWLQTGRAPAHSLKQCSAAVASHGVATPRDASEGCQPDIMLRPDQADEAPSARAAAWRSPGCWPAGGWTGAAAPQAAGSHAGSSQRCGWLRPPGGLADHRPASKACFVYQTTRRRAEPC